MKKVNLDQLEDVTVTFGKRAFSPRQMYCDNCDVKMKIVEREIAVSKDVRVNVEVFVCPRCQEELLGLEEAKKLDRALIISRLLSKKTFGFKRRMSYDGDNYVLRLPKDLTLGKIGTEVTIYPLESNEAVIKW